MIKRVTFPIGGRREAGIKLDSSLISFQGFFVALEFPEGISFAVKNERIAGIQLQSTFISFQGFFITLKPPERISFFVLCAAIPSINFDCPLKIHQPLYIL